MSEVQFPIFNSIPLTDLQKEGGLQQLNEFFRQIDDSLAFLLTNSAVGGSVAGSAFGNIQVLANADLLATTLTEDLVITAGAGISLVTVPGVPNELQIINALPGVTDHTLLTNIGVNTHAQIDTHLADAALHFTEASIDHGNIAGLTDDDHLQYLLISGTRAMTGGLDFNAAGDAVIYNEVLDDDIHFDVNNSANGVNTRAMTIIAEHPTQGAAAIDLRPSDTVFLSNFIFMQQNIELVNSESGFGSTVRWRLDNAVPTAPLRVFTVSTNDAGFGGWSLGLGTGVGNTSNNYSGAFDVEFTIPDGQVFDFQGPITLTDTLTPAAVNMEFIDTFDTLGGFNGGVLRSSGTVTYDNGFFIWALLAELKTYRGNATPSFAAFTLFNALPTIENEGNFNLVQALVLNVGVLHRRRTSGTSTTPGTTGVSLSPQTSASVSGAVMTRTSGITGMRLSPTYQTAVGGTVNLGTIRGIEFFQPAIALFQGSLGTVNMTAYYGLDFPDMTFGGASRIINVIRSQLNAATNVRFINHQGSARSNFLGNITFPADLVGITFGAADDVGMGWAGAGFMFIQFNALADQIRLSNPAANVLRIEGDLATSELEINMDLQHNGTNLGFYSAAPVAQPAAVAVTAIAIHAALVSLGLIT